MIDDQPPSPPPVGEDGKKRPVFQLNDQEGEFEQLEVDPGVPLYQLLDPHFCLLFIDEAHFRAWLWQGRECSTRAKFISAKKAPNVRDKFGPALRITNVDDGDEPHAFKVLVGLEKLEDVMPTKPDVPHITPEDATKLLEELSLEKINAQIEKAGVPEGFELAMVAVGRQLYGVQVQKRNVQGTIIEERKLFPLRDPVPDGTYLIPGYLPRFLFSFNNVVLVEMLKPVNPQT